MPYKLDLGYDFPNGCRITHGTGAEVKRPFSDVDLTMYNFSLKHAPGFSGQFGYIEFNTDIRLPRHIHMDMQKQKLIDERILVLHGVGIVEIAGEYWVVAPGSLVDAVGGVPHTWTACPAGVVLPDGTVSDGKFTMVYEYEDTTAFFPTASTEVITRVEDYKEFKGSYDDIRMPKFTAKEAVERAQIVFNKEKGRLRLA